VADNSLLRTSQSRGR